MKRILLTLTAAAVLFGAGLITGQSTVSTPHTILHVVTVKWKATTTPAQQQQVIDGVLAMSNKVPGVKSVWLKTIKVQPTGYQSAFAMEFTSADAFEKYVSDPAHTDWKKMYDPIHEVSTTHDMTN
jgi:hypothetical protein